MNAGKLTDKPKTKSGGALLFLLLFGAMGALGLAFDFMMTAERGFWLGADPGGRALIGVGAAAFLMLSAHVARLVLSRRLNGGGRDAGDHA